MGLLDRYGVNGEPQPMQVSPLTHDASNDKLARIAVEDPFAETKTRIHNAIIEQQISSGEVVTDDSMRALINEYVEKPEYNRNLPRCFDRVQKIYNQYYEFITSYLWL